MNKLVILSICSVGAVMLLLGAAQQAVLLAQTMDQMPDRRHQLAPILIGLLSNLGLMNNRRQDLSITPQEMLAQIASRRLT